jgi:hypothetical protein
MTFRQLVETVLSMFLLAATCLSQAPPTAEELVKSINDRTSLWSLDRPFHLEADFVTQLDKLNRALVLEIPGQGQMEAGDQPRQLSADHGAEGR